MLKFIKTWYMLQKLDDDRATLRPKNARLAQRYEEHQALSQMLNDASDLHKQDQQEHGVSGRMRANILSEIRQRPVPQPKSSLSPALKLAPYSLLVIVLLALIAALVLPRMQEPADTMTSVDYQEPMPVEVTDALNLFNPAAAERLTTEERAIVVEQLLQNPLESEMNDIADDSAEAGRVLLASLPIQFGTVE